MASFYILIIFVQWFDKYFLFISCHAWCEKFGKIFFPLSVSQTNWVSYFFTIWRKTCRRRGSKMKWSGVGGQRGTRIRSGNVLWQGGGSRGKQGQKQRLAARAFNWGQFVVCCSSTEQKARALVHPTRTFSQSDTAHKGKIQLSCRVAIESTANPERDTTCNAVPIGSFDR